MVLPPTTKRSYAKPASRVRAFWRIKCRQQLSQFLRKQTGLSVPPDEIRLVTHPGDLYEWPHLTEKKHLFKKPLSKHNTGAYREICSAIGKSIEVRKREDKDGMITGSIHGSSSFNIDPSREASNTPSFTSTIETLNKRNEALAESIHGLETTVRERDRSLVALRGQCKMLVEQIRMLHRDLDSSNCQLLKTQQMYAQAELGWADARAKLLNSQDVARELLKQLE